MALQITAPGWWLIKSPQANGVIYYPSKGTLPDAVQGAAYLGQSDISQANLKAAAGQLNLPALFEWPGGLGKIIADAKERGQALYTPGTEGNAQPDWVPTEIVGALALAAAFPLGGVAVGAGEATVGEVGAAGAGGVAAGETAAETAGGSAAGTAAASAASKVASTIASTVTKTVTGLSLAALFTASGTWKGIGMVIAGGVLLLLGLLQAAGKSVRSVMP